MHIGTSSEVLGISRLKPEELPARYWRWAEPKQAEQPRQVDGVELSLRARWMNQLMASTRTDDAAPRGERINEIRAELEAGIYESARKLDVALDRLIDDAASG